MCIDNNKTNVKLFCRGIAYKFSDGHTLRLPDIDCAFSNLMLIKGHIGSGKTVLLKTIANIIQANFGEFSVTVNSQQAESCFVHSQAEFNFVTAQLADELEFAGIKDKSAFSGFIDRNVNELSGGELKKISVMMALASDYGLILLDEPLDMLDDEQSEIMAKYIIEASKTKPIIVATHDVHFDKSADFIIKVGEDKQAHEISRSAKDKNMSDEILRVENVRILLPERTLPVINFSCSKGTIFCIYGANGKGKTLFLRELAGIGRQNAEGKIMWNVEKNNRGACLQFPEQMIYRETVADEIADIAGKNMTETVLTALKWEDKASRSPFSLSDGEKRAMYLLSILISKQVCIFDEPFAGLDYASATYISKCFIDACEEGKTVIYTANRRKDILCADEIYELK